MARWMMVGALVALTLPGCNGESRDAVRSGSATIGGAAESAGDYDGPVELDAISLTPPAGWERTVPSSSILAAEFVLPRAAGDDADGRLTVSTAGGSVDANIDRWQGQFEPQPREASREEMEIAGLTLTLADYSGDFNDQRGPFAPAVLRPNYRMIAAIIPVGGQLYFIKATGPAKTVGAHADEIRRFIRSVKRRE